MSNHNATLTAAELAEEIALNAWMLSCPDVEMSDAQRAFTQADQDALVAEFGKRRNA